MTARHMAPVPCAYFHPSVSLLSFCPHDDDYGNDDDDDDDDRNDRVFPCLFSHFLDVYDRPSIVLSLSFSRDNVRGNRSPAKRRISRYH